MKASGSSGGGGLAMSRRSTPGLLGKIIFIGHASMGYNVQRHRFHEDSYPVTNPVIPASVSLYE